MIVLRVMALLSLVFCLEGYAKGRTKDDRSRAPASTGKSGDESYQSSDGSWRSIEQMPINEGNSNNGSSMQADDGSKERYVGNCLASSTNSTLEGCVAKEKFVRRCLSSTVEGTEEDCANSYDKQNPQSGTAAAATSGSEANCLGPANRWEPTTQACVSATTGEPAADGNGNNSGNTQSEQESQASLCQSAHTSAMSSCDSESQSWMNNINMVADIGGPALGQAKPTASTCSGIAAASVGAKSSLAAFAVMCNSASRTCLSSCATPTDTQSVEFLKQCRAKATKAAEAQQKIQAAVQSLQASVATCQAAFGDINGQAQAHCEANPAACAINMPGGIAGNAISPDQVGGGTNPSLSGGGVGGDVGAGTGFNLSDIGDDGEEGIGQIAPSKPGEDIGGAKGGGGVAGGSSGQGGDAGGGSGGGKKEGLLSNILSGFFGGGGGSGGGGFKSWFGGGNKGDAYSSGQPRAGKGTPDLRQFLPGGANDPNRHRGIAGQFIGRDGMTGPHSDIWKNINNRYQNKRASLLP